MAATRPKVTVARSYENFQPPSKLIQEEDCEILSMELPGFKKEQIRAQMDDREGTLFISGEKPIGSNMWRRFRKEIRVPVNCNKSEIQAKFENELLRVIMPLEVFPKVERVPDQKPIPAPPPPPPPPRQSQNPVTTEPKPTLPPVIEPNPISSPQSPPSKKPDTGSKPIPTSPPPPSQKSNTEPELAPTLEPPPTEYTGSYGRQFAPTRRPSPIDTPYIQPRRPPTSLIPTPVPPQHPLSQELVPDSIPTPVPHDPLSPSQTTDTNQPATLQSKISEIHGIKSKSEMGEDDSSAPVSKVEKHLDLKTGKLKHRAKQEKGKHIIDAKLVKGDIKANASDSVEKVAMEWDESKQYIINMIAAIVVILALWIYTKYTVKTPW